MSFASKAVVMREVGAPDVLEIRDFELSWPGHSDEALVRIEAAGINPADTFFRALGAYLGEGPGTVLGHDGAGVVEAVGDAVTSVQVGDRVCFCNGGLGGDPGTYAHHAIVPEWLLARVPDSVELTTAAALPLVFITAWEALIERAQLRQDETILIHGGAGGTGQIAIQVAREVGARIATTVSSEEKAELACSLGAEIAIDYRNDDFVVAVREWTDGAGVNVAFDNAGPDVFQKTLVAMAPYGRIVTLMGTPGDTDHETAYNGNLTIHNVMMLTPMWRGLQADRRRQGELVRRAMKWLEEDRIKVGIAATFPLEEVAEAHALLEHGGMTGKIVLKVQ
jgi:NADPH2:quinone reductase